jgi:hypothetical protein
VTVIGRSMLIGSVVYKLSLFGNEDGRPTVADRAAFFDSLALGGEGEG